MNQEQWRAEAITEWEKTVVDAESGRYFIKKSFTEGYLSGRQAGEDYTGELINQVNDLKSQLANEIANREAVDSLCANYKAQLAERNEWLREARPWIKWAMNNHHGDMGQANQWYEKTKDLK